MFSGACMSIQHESYQTNQVWTTFTEHELYPARKCCDWGQIFWTVCLLLCNLFTPERPEFKLNCELASLCHFLRRELELDQTGALQLQTLCVFPGMGGTGCTHPVCPITPQETSWYSSWAPEHRHWGLLGYPLHQKAIQLTKVMHSVQHSL